MKNKFSVLVLVASFVMLLAFTYRAPNPPGDWKNLQILPKDISKEKLDSIMDNFKLSLGVKCGFCHVRWADSTKKGLDFASDANKHKNIARNMIKMTANINETFFNPPNSARLDTLQAVVCYTCHRGSPEPDSKKLLAEMNQVQQELKLKQQQQAPKKD